MATRPYFCGAVLLSLLYQIGQSTYAGEELPSLCVAKNGSEFVESGVCVSVRGRIKSCPPLYRLFRDGNWEELKQHYCHDPSSSLIAKICCPLSVYTEVPSQDAEPDYSRHESFTLLPNDHCGRSFRPSNEDQWTDLQPGSFPWMARLEFTDENGFSPQYSCGATLINKRYVLTAAHCLAKSDHTLKNVRLAENDEDKEIECITDCSSDCKNSSYPPSGVVACSEALDFTPEKIILHPGYTDSPGSHNDIALIRLSKDVNDTSLFIVPICLPFLKLHNVEEELEDWKLTESRKEGDIVGWGRVSNEQIFGSSALKKSVAPFLPAVVCQLTHRNNTIDRTQLCAGGLDNGGPCLGDSGTPLLYSALSSFGNNSTKRQFQLGIVSYGRTKCGLGSGVPVVYTRVRSYLTWILDNLRP